jgi:hypothetical protein
MTLVMDEEVRVDGSVQITGCLEKIYSSYSLQNGQNDATFSSN